MIFDSSSIPLMISHLKHLRQGDADPKFLEALFRHEDYQFEFRRYGISDTRELVHYFSRLGSIEEADIPDFSQDRKDALRHKHSLWLAAVRDPEKYENLYENLRALLDRTYIERVYMDLQRAFPVRIDLSGTRAISTMSIGPSFGYVFENALHFDLLGIGKYCSLEDFSTLIEHELHHLQMMQYLGNYAAFTRNFSAVEEYLFRFTGEGLAIKFCNNAGGILSSPVSSSRPVNQGLDPFSIRYFMDHFQESFQLFSGSLLAIQEKRLTRQQIEDQFKTYWWNPYLPDQDPSEPPKLLQTPIYMMGSELFGTIYDAFGLKTLFECLHTPIKTVSYFNRAVRAKDPSSAYLLPELN